MTEIQNIGYILTSTQTHTWVLKKNSMLCEFETAHDTGIYHRIWYELLKISKLVLALVASWAKPDMEPTLSAVVLQFINMILADNNFLPCKPSD